MNKTIPKPTKDQRVIRVVDWLLEDDLCEDLEMQMASPDSRKKMSKDLIFAAEKLLKLYRIAHAFDRSNSCYRVHEDWRKEFLNTEKEMNKELKKWA